MDTPPKPQPPLQDTPASHLRNALQILSLAQNRSQRGFAPPATDWMWMSEPEFAAVVRRIDEAVRQLEEIRQHVQNIQLLDQMLEMQKTNRELQNRGDALAVEEALER